MTWFDLVLINPWYKEQDYLSKLIVSLFLNWLMQTKKKTEPLIILFWNRLIDNWMHPDSLFVTKL